MSTHIIRARLRARSTLAAAAVAGTLGLVSAGAPPASAHDDGHGSHYLALGDSVSFGYITQAGFEYGNPTNFIGFPEKVGADRSLDVVNASCAGQTSTSLITGGQPDNGCIAYRSHFPLHVSYQGTQLAFADQFLAAHRDTRLVTLLIGANDAFVLQKQCASAPDPTACFQAGLPALTQTIGANLNTIFNSLRSTGYRGRIVALTYYSLDYSDAAGTGLTQLLNSVITQSAAAHHVTVADAFATFKAATSTQFAGGSSCKAGLLNASPQNQFLCDVHPSQSGQQLLARTVEDAIAEAGGDD